MKTVRNLKHKHIKILLSICITWELEKASCSRVMDGMEKNAIKVSEYCPKTEHCEEGSHVICMYYDPNAAAGPSCAGFMNKTITADLALKILDITNGMRAKVAQGKETGKDNQYIPRGYGMMRLKWDSELATFAQVLANQCSSKKGDLCRASSRFPDPEQNIAVIRFARPNWNITIARRPDDIMKKLNSTKLLENGLNDYKILYGIYKMMESWYNLKKSLETNLILKYPDFSKDQTHIDAKRIMSLLSGSATHMGCGMSAFSTYTHHNRTENKYNSIIMVCNIAGRSKPGESVYETEPPSKVGYTIRCGCPPGYEEDDECLCYESPQSSSIGRRGSKNNEAASHCDGYNKNCKPAVVLLPIVTAEDAPPSKLTIRRGNDRAFDMYHKYEDDINDAAGFGTFVDRINGIDGESNTYLPTVPFVESSTSRNNYKDMMIMRDVKRRYFNKKRNDEIQLGHEIGPLREDNGRLGHDLRFGHRGVRLSHGKANLEYGNDVMLNEDSKYRRRKFADEKRSLRNEGIIGRQDNEILRSVKERTKVNTDKDEPGLHPPVKRVSRKSPHYGKESLFSRVPKFELPSNSYYSQKLIMKADVAPRKDFTNAKTLLDNYMKKRKQSHIVNDFRSSILYPNKIIDRIIPPSNTNSDLDKYLTRKFNYQGMEEYGNNEQRPIEIRTFNEESDKKLMSLLDVLEQEVNNIELTMNEKEIFDAKIRKIYGQVVGKPEILSHKNVADIAAEDSDDRKDNFAKYETAVNNHLAMDRFDEYDPLMPKPRPQNNFSFRGKQRTSTFTSIENDVQLRRSKKPSHNDLNQLMAKRKNFIQSNYETSPSKIPFAYTNRNRPIYRRKIIDEEVKYPRKTRFIKKDNGKGRYGNDGKIERMLPGDEQKGKKYSKTEDNDELDAERQKYYQDKLDKIERKLHEARRSRIRNEHQKDHRDGGLTQNDYRRRKTEIDLRGDSPKSLEQNYYESDRDMNHGFG